MSEYKILSICYVDEKRPTLEKKTPKEVMISIEANIWNSGGMIRNRQNDKREDIRISLAEVIGNSYSHSLK